MRHGVWMTAGLLAMAGASRAAETPVPTAAPAETVRRESIAVIDGTTPSSGTSSGGGEIKGALPPDMPTDDTPRAVTVKGAWDKNRDSQDATPLKGAQVLSIMSGSARLKLADGTERALKVGDTVGADVVKSVTSERIVLERDTENEKATVVLSVAGGRTRLRVYAIPHDEPGPVPTR
jgi:hypothetical protein